MNVKVDKEQATIIFTALNAEADKCNIIFFLCSFHFIMRLTVYSIMIIHEKMFVSSQFS